MNARGFLRLSWVESKLLVREPTTLFFTIVLPILFFVVLSLIFGNTSDPAIKGGAGSIDYHMGAYVALIVSSIGLIGLPAHLAGYRETGVLRRLRASNVKASQILGSQLVVTAGVSLAATLLMFVVAGFMFRPRWPHDPAAVAAAVSLTLAEFWAIGGLLGAVLPGPRSAQFAGMGLFFVMFLLGGAGPPTEILPAALRIIGDATPIKHAVLIIQDPWIGLAWEPLEWLASGAFLAAAAGLAFLFFRWE